MRLFILAGAEERGAKGPEGEGGPGEGEQGGVKLADFGAAGFAQDGGVLRAVADVFE
jgi:hypothetical protein